MLDAAQEALSFLKGKTKTSMDHDRMLILSLTRCIEIIGEAASQVTPEFKTSHPQIPWQPMTGMRNRLIHAYFDVDVNRVWDTVFEDLPPLIVELEKALAEERK